MAKKNKQTKQKARKGIPTFIVLPLMIGIIVFFKAAFVLLLLGMLPSIIANYADNTKDRLQVSTIFCCNFAGVLPYFVPYAQNGGDLDFLMHYMADANMWLMIYGMAACGYGLVKFCPMLCHVFLRLSYSSKAFQMQQKQDALLKEWGDEIEAIATQTMAAEV